MKVNRMPAAVRIQSCLWVEEPPGLSLGLFRIYFNLLPLLLLAFFTRLDSCGHSSSKFNLKQNLSLDMWID